MQPPAPSSIAKRPDGRLVAVAGKSRSGKTVWTAQQVATSPRLLVWDYKSEWHLKYRCRRVRSFRELAQVVKSTARAGRFAFSIPFMDAAKFDLFCRFAWIWCQQGEGDLVIEETASVTTPAKAPAAWGEIVRMALGYGVNLYPITQRPAESDKTALGNATVVHCHMMKTEGDRRYMAQLLDVDVARVAALKPLEYIERHDSGELLTGKVQIRRRRKEHASDDRRSIAVE